MPKMYFPSESVGRDGRNAPSPGNPASYPITGRRRIATLSKGGGARYLRDDLGDNSILLDDLGDGSPLIDDLAA